MTRGHIIKDVSGGVINPPKLMIVLPYIDSGGNLQSKKCQIKYGQLFAGCLLRLRATSVTLVLDKALHNHCFDFYRLRGFESVLSIIKEFVKYFAFQNMTFCISKYDKEG